MHLALKECANVAIIGITYNPAINLNFLEVYDYYDHQLSISFLYITTAYIRDGNR